MSYFQQRAERGAKELIKNVRAYEVLLIGNGFLIRPSLGVALPHSRLTGVDDL